MVKRFLFILMALIISTCLVCSNVSVLATGSLPDLNIEDLPGGGLEDEPETEQEEPVTEQEPQTEQQEPETEQEEPQTEARPTPNPTPNPVPNRPVTNDTGDDEDEETTEAGAFSVKVELLGGELPEGHKMSFEMEEPGKVKEPSAPEKVGYLFDGWYSDDAFKNKWDFENDIAEEEMTLYAKWIRDPAAILYNIVVNEVSGGKITVKPEKAVAGEMVLIMVQPAEGNRLANGSLKINGEVSDILSFEMPAGDVVIEATFEKAPVEKVEDDYTFVILAVAGCVALAVVIVAVVTIRRRNTIIVPEFDEDGAIIIEDNDDFWVDESIVVEDGFLDGKKKSDISPPDIEDD